MRRRWLAAALAAVLVSAATAGAQTLESGQVHGTVYDETKAALPGVTATLTNPATGLTRTNISNASGAYQFAQIPRGTYNLLVELTGFAPAKFTGLVVSVGASLTLDVTLRVGTQSELVEVVGTAAAIDTGRSGVSQLIDERNIANLPLSGRDYRDLAQLSPSAQVVPGLRGGIRLGGQQSDYTGLAIDGGDARDNFFGEFFGSLETKNFTIPLEAVQEFQVVTNGFAPEFGRSTGGLINVVTKSGANKTQGSAHYFYRGKNLTKDDALGTPSNIDNQHQYGASLGGPIQKDKQFYFLAFDVQRRNGPLVTKFARDVSGVPATEWGIADLASLEGTHTQFQNLFTVLGKYDLQVGSSDRISLRAFYSQNKTDGFTGGRGQNQIQADFGNTEHFENSGYNAVLTWNKALLNGKGSNELKVSYYDNKRPRDPNSHIPQIVIGDTGTFGQRFFLPITGDDDKFQVQENFQYAFGNHDVKFGADANLFAIRNNLFYGWSAGEYDFATLEDFEAKRPYAFIQGFGFNGVPYKDAAIAANRSKQSGYGFYAQDKWRVSRSLTLNYGLRFDGTTNPTPTHTIQGQKVYSGVAPDLSTGPPPQGPPSDWKQWGPRVGLAYSFNVGSKAAVFRANWGLYYAQIPTIFMTTPQGAGEVGQNFCFFNPACLPPGGYPHLNPDSVPGPPSGGVFNTNYDDPKLRNPRVMNTTATFELNLSKNYTLTATYVYAKSDFLRTGGFSSTQWNRNFIKAGEDKFGRAILGGPLDPTIAAALANGSSSRGNFNQVVVNLTRAWANRYQFFVNYAWSQSKDNASSERDTDTFFSPQDPFNIELDYGRNALDIPHQFKAAFTAELGAGFRLGAAFIARSGVPYPAYILADTNGDGVGNSGFSNDRPVVNDSFLLERYPARQPSFYQLDFRLSKEFSLGQGRAIEILAEFFNVLNNENLYSNPNVSAVVPAVLSKVPQPGDCFAADGCGTGKSPAYRTLDQISPGSTPFAVQLGARFRF
jgi:carboxypeptidase family protein